MKKQKVNDRMMAWAEAGAALELRLIYATFPRLRPAAPKPSAAAGSAPPPVRRKRRMSKAGRKAISDAQKARWAKRR